MRLLRYGPSGQEKPAALDTTGNIRDLSGYVDDFDSNSLSNSNLLDLLKHIDLKQLKRVVGPNLRIGSCIKTHGKMICIGFNSKLHAEELGLRISPDEEMMFFLKANSAICGPNDPILFTKMTKKLDWEGELGVIIGKQGKYIAKSQAKDYIFGYCCVNDLSERYWQLETKDTQYTKGKCFDHSAPIGPYLVTRDEIINSSDLQIKLSINGVLRQNFNTCDYIHNDEAVISYVSQFFTLHPGDIISMGSAPGSARAWGDEYFLKPNDEVVLSIDGLGQQQQIVVIE